ncbi:MAG: hypothetical protein SH817_11650 [Leptospira sp.]|nr:hypothetical protein [Leptospira sp.]
MKSRHKHILILLFVCLPCLLFADAYSTIKWNAIENAGGYTIEIKDEAGKTIFENTKEPNVKVKLPIGKYNYRIAVINKFKRIEKWSAWNDLEIRPVAIPVVNTATSEVQTIGNSEKITFNGDNIYEGTKAYVIQDGKKIPATIQTSRDGKVSVVTIDTKLVDKKKNYKVTLENPNFDPIEVPIVGKQTAVWEDQTAEKHTSEITPLSESSRRNNIWPMFWRQALLPGWGHYYIGDKKTAYAYMSIFGITSLYTINEYLEYRSQLLEFRTQQNYLESIRALDPDAAIFPFFATTIVEDYYSTKVDERGKRINSSLSVVGLVYVTSLAHILITGYTRKMPEANKQTFHIGIRPEEQTILSRTNDPNHVRFDLRYNFYY